MTGPQVFYLRRCERQGRQVQGFNGAFQRALQIKEIQVAHALSPLGLPQAAGGNQCQRFTLERQLADRHTAKNAARFEQADIAKTLVEIVSQRTEHTRQEGRTHARSFFDDRI